MKLSFFSSAIVARFHAEAATNVAKYGNDPSWIDAFAGGKPYIFESSRVVDPAPALIVTATDNPKNDAENAKRIYNWLKGLTPAIAMEERLWTYLTHCVFPQYMAARWQVEDGNSVQRRYLFEGKTFSALARNGISRLWWAGKLTCDEKRSNPFELTEVLFLRQDIQVSLLERAIGKCDNVRTAVLDFLRDNSGWLAEEEFGRRIQLLIKELNLLGGVAILDALSQPQLQQFLKKVGESLAKPETAQTS
jgi:hypothetical protein